MFSIFILIISGGLAVCQVSDNHNNNLYNQKDILIEPPKPPILDRVWIDPENNQVKVDWFPSPDLNVVGYGIQEEFPVGESRVVKNIIGNITNASFVFPRVLTDSVRFNMDTYVILDNKDTSRSIRTPSHRTIFATLKYDSCNNSFVIKWTPYLGWGDALAGYNIAWYKSAFTYPQITEVGPLKFEYNITEVPETPINVPIQKNQNYCFLVIALRNDGKASYSKKVCLDTKVSLPPSFIAGSSSDFSTQKQVTLNFNIDPATVSDSYRLYRSVATSDDYKPLADINKNGSVISYTDALPSTNVYNYKLVYLDGCKNEGVSSIPINNILLKGKSQSMTNNLSWNSFSSWAQGTNEVHIYRNNSGGTRELLTTVSPSITEYADIINAQDQLSGDLCYQVEFVSNPDSNGKVNKSLSNIFCVNMLGQVFVPNAFTPNNDGRNDEFKPTFAILPARYTFIIYNRYGAKIFETNNVSDGWNGILSDGKKALEGAYIYYIKLENGVGEVLENRGNFTVIYP